MARFTEDPASVAGLFHAAAIGMAEWGDALSALAGLTGSFTGELLGFGRADTLTFYCQNGFAPDLIEEFQAARGYDPNVNSRVRIGLRARPFQILDEHDFTTAQDMQRHPAYGEYIRKIDGPYICLTNLIREDGRAVGLSVMRTQAQGHISPTERRVFAAMLPHIRSAIQTHLTLEDRQLSLMADTFERVSACAFVCDAGGTLRAMSGKAEALLRQGEWLSVRDNVLVARNGDDNRRLHAAVRAAALAGGGMGTPPPPFTVRNVAGELLPLEAMPYVAMSGSRSGSMVVLLARPPCDVGVAAFDLAKSLFHLTDREAAIAAELTRGRSVAEIARSSGAAIGTVRVHLRNIFEKLGVNNQAQVVAKLSAYR